jgi:hypothetical protein
MISLGRASNDSISGCSKLNALVALASLFILICFSAFSVLKVGLYLDDFTYIKLLHFYPVEMFWQGCTGRQMLLPAFGEHYRPALTLFYLCQLSCLSRLLSAPHPVRAAAVWYLHEKATDCQLDLSDFFSAPFAHRSSLLVDGQE